MSLVLGVRRSGYMILVSDRRSSNTENVYITPNDLRSTCDSHSKVHRISRGYIAASGETVLIDYFLQNVEEVCMQKSDGLCLASCLNYAAVKRVNEGLPKEFAVTQALAIMHNGRFLEMHVATCNGSFTSSAPVEPESFELSAFAGLPDGADFYKQLVKKIKSRSEFDSEHDYQMHIAHWAKDFMRWQLGFDPSISPLFDLLIFNEQTSLFQKWSVDVGPGYGYELGTPYRRDLHHTPHGLFVTMESAKAAQALIEQRQKIANTKPVDSGRVVKWTLQDIQQLQNPLYKIVK